jgi:hypothetical protein
MRQVSEHNYLGTDSAASERRQPSKRKCVVGLLFLVDRDIRYEINVFTHASYGTRPMRVKIITFPLEHGS